MPSVYPLKALAAMILIIVLTGGCATLNSGLEPPGVSLASIRVKEIRGFETSFEVDLRVLNRSEVPMVLQGLTCELNLGGRQLAEGVGNPQIEIAPYDSGIVSIMVYSSMLDMVGVARRLMRAVNQDTGGETITYEVSGHLVGGSTGYSGKFPYAAKGELDLDELARDL